MKLNSKGFTGLEVLGVYQLIQLAFYTFAFGALVVTAATATTAKKEDPKKQEQVVQKDKADVIAKTWATKQKN